MEKTLLCSIPWFWVHFQVCNQHTHRRSHTLKGPVLDLRPCSHHLDILNNFIFELGFCKQSPIGWWSLRENRGDTAVCVSSSACSYCSVSNAPLTQHPSGPTMCVISNQVQGKHVKFMTGYDISQRPYFPAKPELASNSGSRQMVQLKKHQQSRNFWRGNIIFSLPFWVLG